MYIDSMYADCFTGSVIERRKKRLHLSFLTASSIFYVTTFYYVTFGFILFCSLSPVVVVLIVMVCFKCKGSDFYFVLCVSWALLLHQLVFPHL